MAYYKKQEVVNFITEACEKIKEAKHTPLTNPQTALQQLTDEQDLVSFFWLELSTSANDVGIKMEGTVFVRLDAEFYCNDRFALDSYQAAKDGVSVTDIIKKREQEQQESKKNINPDMLEALKSMLLKQDSE